MIRTAYIIREIGRDLYRNLGTVLASLLSLTLLLLLFDLFWIASGTADRFYKNLLSDLRVEVFVDEAVSDSSLTDVSVKLVGVEGVIDFEFINRDEARRRLAEMVGTDLLVGYDSTNPLPRSYVLKVDEDHRNGEALSKMEATLRGISGLSEIHYSREWLDKAEQVRGVILRIGFVLGILTLAGALVGSANNMRLMTRAQAVGFRQKLLLGASRMFVVLPSLIESFLISGLAAALGWALIFYGRTKVGFARIDLVFPPARDIVLFCLAAGLLGAIAGLLGLRKMLGPSMKHRFAIFLIVLFGSVLTVEADDHSSDIVRQQQELEKIQKDVTAGQKRLDSLEAEQAKVQKAISKYDEKLTSDRKVLKRLNNDLAKIKADIKRGDSLLVQASELVDRRRRRYLGNIRQFYSLASQTNVAVSDTPEEELDRQRRLIYLTALAGFESGTVRDASDLVAKSADALDGMSDRQKQISGLKKERETSRALGETQRQRQAKNLDQLRRKSMTEADRVISLRQAAEDMQGIIAQLEEARTRRAARQPETGPSVFASLQGQLLAPYKGKIIQAYGEHVDPVSRLKSFSPGVTIKGKSGGDVLAVASGTVAYSGSLRGYGNFVIINHDHQYYSTYAGLGEILVSEGQYVSTSARIGKADTDGSIRFELRKGRESLDPVKWIRFESL